MIVSVPSEYTKSHGPVPVNAMLISGGVSPAQIVLAPTILNVAVGKSFVKTFTDPPKEVAAHPLSSVKEITL